MRAVVGLGNPGPEYARTRHNAGFVLADAIAAKWGLGPFRREGRLRHTQGELPDGPPVAVLKPQTYMNRSGTALGPLLEVPSWNPAEDLLVVVDEAALPLGTFRLRRQGSAGGHNGLKSVQHALQSLAYPRLRIGVGPVPPDVEDLSDFVLAEFGDEEWHALDALVPRMIDAVECWARSGIDDAMNQFNQPREAE